MSTTCDLCGADGDLADHTVSPRSESIATCGICGPQLAADATLDANHWYCLQGAIWSERAAVQVVSHRLLQRLQGEGWAVDLLDQAYLDEDTLAWAQEGQDDGGDDEDAPRDSNGAELHDGDSVTLIKDLVVKGGNFTAKRGTMVKSIKVGDDPTHVEGRINKMSIMLKTAFLKRA